LNIFPLKFIESSPKNHLSFLFKKDLEYLFQKKFDQITSAKVADKILSSLSFKMLARKTQELPQGISFD
jgi:plasmid replication initiation protein